jgi:hypothetical protein
MCFSTSRCSPFRRSHKRVTVSSVGVSRSAAFLWLGVDSGLRTGVTLCTDFSLDDGDIGAIWQVIAASSVRAMINDLFVSAVPRKAASQLRQVVSGPGYPDSPRPPRGFWRRNPEVAEKLLDPALARRYSPGHGPPSDEVKATRDLAAWSVDHHGKGARRASNGANTEVVFHGASG